MPKTTPSYKETKLGVLSVSEIEGLVFDNLVQAKSFIFRGRTTRLFGELFLLKAGLPLTSFSGSSRDDFSKAMRYMTQTGDMSKIKDLL